MMDIAGKKAELRKRVRASRRAIGEEERRSAAEAVAERLLAIPEMTCARYVLAYMPMKYELDVLPAVERLKAVGAIPVFPLCIEGGGLKLLVPADENGFTVGAYGILEPDITTAREVDAAELDAIILPAIAFDASGKRLGQGGGYYDRLLARTSCFCAAVGFDYQLVDEIPTEETDRSVDVVVTPSETIRP
jgi:5-formyltetrahydrofolate cyclo-ligase